MENTQETVQNTSQTTKDNLQNITQTTEDNVANVTENESCQSEKSFQSKEPSSSIQSNTNSTLSFIKSIARPDLMDKPNKDGYDVLIAGIEKNDSSEFIKQVFTDQETGRNMSYSEMRARYS